MSIKGNNIRYVRVRAFAKNPEVLGDGDFIQIQRWDREDTPIIGWVFHLDPDNNALPVVDAAQLLAIKTLPDMTDQFGGPFQTAYEAGSLPTWSMPPRFTFYPVSASATCAALNTTIDGIGRPFNELYF
ncbi:MAG: hypothetical protein MUF87_02410 [Anaerolineae bacterium]|nr:hypothetical protein [Anaerolineae bacterium]